MSYAEALYFVRVSLTMPWRQNPVRTGGNIQSYMVHGLKSTFLSWSQQLNLPEEQRRLQGKHKAQQSSMRLYSRDDIHGALELQRALVTAVREGFRPTTPLSRGGQQPMEEPRFDLQVFSKQASDYVWQYFKFHEPPSVPADPPIVLEDGAQSDSSSASSSSFIIVIGDLAGIRCGQAPTSAQS